MKNRDIIFEEIEHWLRFIKLWQKEHQAPVPEQALLSLEIALEKAMSLCWLEHTCIKTNEPTNKLVH